MTLCSTASDDHDVERHERCHWRRLKSFRAMLISDSALSYLSINALPSIKVYFDAPSFSIKSRIGCTNLIACRLTETEDLGLCNNDCGSCLLFHSIPPKGGRDSVCFAVNPAVRLSQARRVPLRAVAALIPRKGFVGGDKLALTDSKPVAGTVPIERVMGHAAADVLQLGAADLGLELFHLMLIGPENPERHDMTRRASVSEGFS